MTDYAAGTPSWVELSTTDPDGSYAFYSQLFGWTATEGTEQFGGYRSFLDGGQSVGGLNPMGEFPVWTTYVATDDADATAQKVRDNGGTVMVEPMDVGVLGRMAVFVDPAGAVFGAWQAGEMKGADKVNEPNSFVWNELATRDLDGARAFYPAVFGWDPQPFGEAPPGQEPYYVWNNGGERGAGGAMTMPEMVPADVPSYWGVYFAVADADATVAKAEELGGRVLFGPEDIPEVGRFATLMDPQGAAFSVLKPQMPDE
jgi:hypothetical protein